MRKMWPRLLFTMLLTACLLPEARGQFLPAAHHFRAYTTADGLPDNQITCLLQDAQGFAWIGTSQGLSCFDGVQFVNYYKESDNPNSLPSNHINGMILLPDSNLVIATRFGLALLNPAERRFRRIAMPSAPEMAHINNNINTLHFTRRKELVVGHNAGFCVFDSNMQLRYDYLHFKAADLDKQTMGFSHAFLPLSNGDVAIRGWQGSWLYVAEKHTVIPLDPGSLADRVLGPSNFLGGETPFLCWEYFPKTITLCEPGSGRSGTTDIEDSISREMHWTTKIRLVNDTLMGFTGCNFGFRTASIDSATLRIRFSKQAIFTDRFFKDFMLDREGRWWLASNQGLLVQSLNRGHFRRVDLPQIRQDKDYNPTLTGFTKAGNYFIVAQPNYLHLYDARFRLLTSTRFQPEEMNIWGVVSNQAEMADIWSSTGWKRTPLQSLEKSKPDWKRIGPPLPTLWQLKDSRGTIWTGTATGLFKYHPSEGDSLFLENEGPHGKFPRQGASRIIETDSGYIWMCGLPGLTRWNPYAAKFDRYHPKLPGAEQEEGFPSAMVDNGDGELLVVLQNNGLWRWNTRSNQSQKLDFAAPVLNSVLDIFPDSRPKHYWLLLKSGFALMEANTLKYRYYTIPDGLPEKNRIIDIYLDRSTDSLYLGFEDQILIAGRNDLDFSNHPNTVYITEVQKMLSGQKMSFSVPFTLSPSDQDLSVFFSSPETERGNQLIFEYRLNEGNWQKIGSARSIRLINLAPGRYQLAVRALTPEGLSGPPAEVHFEVLPRFFQTWWFLTGIAGVVFLLIYSYFNRQLRQVKKMDQLRQSIAADLHDEVGASLTSIQILSEIARHADEAQQHSALEKLPHQIRSTAASLREIVWNVNPKNDDINLFMGYLSRYAGEALDPTGITYDISIAPFDKRLALAPAAGAQLTRFFKEVINNIIKHSKASRVNIQMEHSRDIFILKMEDNGCGFDIKVAHQGNGINNLIQRAAAAKGKVAIQSTPGAGTLIILRLPLERKRKRLFF